jgi:hypothetical protein
MFGIKRRSFIVESLVVAIDVTKVTGRTHDVVPGGSLNREKASNVMECPPHLCTKVPNVNAVPVLIDTGRARDEKDGEFSEIDAHSSGK